MKKRVVVWGTGNVGRPAIRAVVAHQDLELVGAVAASPAQVGRDAGEIAGIAPTGVLATSDGMGLLACGALREHARRTHAEIDRLDWQIIAVDTRTPLTPSDAVRAHDREGT